MRLESLDCYSLVQDLLEYPCESQYDNRKMTSQQFLDGDIGQLGQLIRQYDWAKTSARAIDQRPLS